jgi:hypothetical protein
MCRASLCTEEKKALQLKSMENPYRSPMTTSAQTWDWRKVFSSRPRQFVMGVVVLMGLLAIIALLNPVAVWDGHFQLNMDIHSRSSQAVEHVSCAFSFRRADAEWLSESDSLEATLLFQAVREFDGQNYVAYGQSSGRTWWGIDYGYTAHRFVVLRIDCEDGKQVRTVVEIPNVRGPRSVTVEIP